MITLCLRKNHYLAVAALLLLMFAPQSSSGQDLPEIPLVYDMGISARAMGMGQAHVAICEDVSAIYYNPAALAQVRRIEMSVSFSHLAEDVETSLYGSDLTTTLGSTKLSSFGIAYPFPTYRGSFVVGFAYNRIRNTDSDFMKYGPVPIYYLDDYGQVSGVEKEGIFERGGLSSWTVALGTDVSPEVSVGASLSFLTGSSERTYGQTIWNMDEGPPVVEDFFKADDADITGWTAALGTVAKVGNVGRVGLAVRLPEHITLDGTEYWEDYDPTLAEYYYDEFLFEDEITLPLSFVAGVSAAPVPGLILAFDTKYTDWKQIDYAGPIRIDNIYAYEATTSLRFGAEFMFPFAPLRIRGGFFTEPLAYRLLPDLTGSGDIWIAQVDSNGKFFTLGGGLLLEESFTIDAAWVHGGYERSIPDYTEKKTTDKLFVTAGYRF
jgi:long-subunit fatty acid transport protein